MNSTQVLLLKYAIQDYCMFVDLPQSAIDLQSVFEQKKIEIRNELVFWVQISDVLN